MQFNSLIILGIILLAGFIFSLFVYYLKLPKVTGYILAGIILGISFFNLVDIKIQNNFSIINDIALGIIAFTVGLELNFKKLKSLGSTIIWIALLECIGAFIFVGLCVFLYTNKIYTALILGAIASATAPAATVMVLREYKAKGILTTTILAIVAIDDSIALIIYGFASATAKIFISSTQTLNFNTIFIHPLIEISGSILLGIICGTIFTLLFYKIKKKSDFLIIMLAGILLCDGIANKLGLSELLSNMSFGIFLTNFTKFNIYKINDSFENFAPPFYILFFVIAGSKLNIYSFKTAGILSILYFISRFTGKVSGASLGAKISNASKNVKKYIGFSLIPQVGVAVAMAIMVNREFSQYGKAGIELSVLVINILLFSTILTEIIGPFLTKFALTKSKEI